MKLSMFSKGASKRWHSLQVSLAVGLNKIGAEGGVDLVAMPRYLLASESQSLSSMLTWPCQTVHTIVRNQRVSLSCKDQKANTDSLFVFYQRRVTKFRNPMQAIFLR